MSGFAVRTAVPADAEAVSALLATSYGTLLPGHYEAGVLASALPLMTRARPELLASGTYLVAVRDHDATLIGCGGWTREAPRGDDQFGRAHIRHFATLPSSVRNGVGRALLQRCLREIAAAQFREAECLSTLMAEPFYAREGFRRIAQVTVRLGDGVDFPAVKMLRTFQ